MAIDSATSVIEDKTKDVFADVTAANAKVSSQIGALSGAFSAEAALMDQKNLNIVRDALRAYMMSADDIIRTIEQKQSIIEKIEADLYSEKTITGKIPNESKLIEIAEKYGDVDETNQKITIEGKYEISFTEIEGWSE